MEPPTAAEREAVAALASQYDRLREEMPFGSARTRKMASKFAAMKAQAASVRSLLPELQRGGSAGQRLVAIAILNMFPNAGALDWLAERVDPTQERNFVAYQAAVALLQAARSLPSSDCAKLRPAVATALRFAERVTDDPNRIEVLRTAESELQRRCTVA